MADAARIMTIDFSKAASIRHHKSGKIRDRGHATDARPVNEDGKLLTPKQIRARARRKASKTSKRAQRQGIMSEQEFEALYKPIEDWDLEELARGRPRGVDGTFRGRKPGWITREVHEKAMEMFIETTKASMGALTPTALDSIRYVLENEEVDERGKPIVPASAKNQASMFILEHVVGKPKQQVTQDISVKLQGILGAVMVNPNDALAPPEQGGMGGYQLAHYPGQTIPIGALAAADDGDSDLDEGGE
jgi:hypothetical protein